ncbi:hypothetical protein H696_00955 [Fonticula alba]|uniref:Golgi apparatus membrane protein TVP23 homolog n=1 Tax=Fonticula alba TaxID=691883 RepID=A0A058ZHK1_FONAL|nr:hypothetical protein H696_00955 [Fonticula alba]KCV73418.1 hypothetical protein H696_00955 [Fonticula alba]|eukprot:XP_009493119.1 hypothetical protein H696_00955 [Fonticula alba]
MELHLPLILPPPSPLFASIPLALSAPRIAFLQSITPTAFAMSTPFDVEANLAPAAAPQQEAPAEKKSNSPAIIRNSSHPIAVIFHLLFRVLSILSYLLCTFITKNFVLSFVLTVILLACDFWTVKNITGRLLVGLRWWNEVREDGSTEWIFESRDPATSGPPNKSDSIVFWYALYLTPAVWLLLAIACIFQFSFSWLAVVAVALALSMANVIGYIKCARVAKARAKAAGSGSVVSDPLDQATQMATDSMGRMIADNLWQQMKSSAQTPGQ